ncbi:MAG: M15 family metallopeptidase [Gemmatimonadales bacterium]
MKGVLFGRKQRRTGPDHRNGKGRRRWKRPQRTPFCAPPSVRRSGCPSVRLFSLAALCLACRPPAQAPPAEPPAGWRGLIGEYGSDSVTRVMVLERNGALLARFDSATEVTLTPDGPDRFRGAGQVFRFRTGAPGVAPAVAVNDSIWRRRPFGDETGFRIVPVQPVKELRGEAMAATPPAESGEFRATDLVELVRLDSTIRLDIRYATSRNFLGVPVYSQARAFLQRPAAEALVRAHRKLRGLGYGLLIHDAYRPWYVTKIFWDATPPAQHDFVADPAGGSRHNRGSAVDLTLYDRRTGQPVEMPGGYDEFSHRSYPDYPGGTSRQRWHRDLLRRVMEAEGLTVYPQEWWHFDYRDWGSYRIGNLPFEQLPD